MSKDVGSLVRKSVRAIELDGISIDEFCELSYELCEISHGSCNGKVIVSLLAASGTALHMIGNRLMPFCSEDKPAIVVPARFADTTMQFSGHFDRCRAGDELTVYVPAFDSACSVPDVLVKQGVWLRNYDGRFVHALLYKSFTDFENLRNTNEFSLRTSVLVPVIRVDDNPKNTVTLLRVQAGSLIGVKNPVVRLRCQKGANFSVLHDGLPNDGSLECLRSSMTKFRPTFDALRSFFSPANNSISLSVAKELVELLVSTQTANPSHTRSLLMHSASNGAG